MVGRRKVLLGLAALGGGFGVGTLLPGNQEPTKEAGLIAARAPTATEVPRPIDVPPATEVPRASLPPLETPAAATPTTPPRAVPATSPSPIPVRATRSVSTTRVVVSPTVASRRAAAASPEISRVQSSRRVLALTFDAGADGGATGQTLAVLRDRSIRATFFVTGRVAELFPALVRQMAADGHEIANHTYDHKDLIDLSNDQIAAELEKTDAILRGFSGATTKPLMRAPFGSRDERVRAAIDAAGYRSIYWAVDGGDWKSGATPGAVIATLRKAAAGDVVVMHCSSAPTAAALSSILADFGRRGLSVVTVSALMAG